MRLQLLLAVFLPLAFVLMGFNGTGQLALATALTAGIAIILSICVPPAPTGAPARTRAIALRERARRSTFLRLRDPDASGRPRSRAPSAVRAAA
jgi:hypothetical protein